MALESNIAVFMLSMGLFLFFRAVKTKGGLSFFFSMIFMALSIWGYHSEWILTPMIMIYLAFNYWGKLKINLAFWFCILVFSILVFPIANDAWTNRSTNARANTEIILKDPGVAKILSDPETSLVKKVGTITQSFTTNYSNYTKLSHLFFDGLALLPKDDPYSVGLFLLPLLPFFLYGLFKIKNLFPKNYKFIYFWLIASPIVPSLTIGGTNMVRNLASVLPYSIVIASGLYSFRFYLDALKVACVSLVILISFGYFLAIYYYHFPFQMGENFQYGYKQAAEYIKNNYDKYDQIVVDPRFGKTNIYVGVPHLYLAYFTNLDPNKMLLRKDNKDGLFFDKYRISSINWNQELVETKRLYLVPFDNFPSEGNRNLRTVKEIKLPNYIVEFKLFESY
jgi:hypothetical protein